MNVLARVVRNDDGDRLTRVAVVQLSGKVIYCSVEIVVRLKRPALT